MPQNETATFSGPVIPILELAKKHRLMLKATFTVRNNRSRPFKKIATETPSNISFICIDGNLPEITRLYSIAIKLESPDDGYMSRELSHYVVKAIIGGETSREWQCEAKDFSAFEDEIIRQFCRNYEEYFEIAWPKQECANEFESWFSDVIKLAKPWEKRISRAAYLELVGRVIDFVHYCAVGYFPDLAVDIVADYVRDMVPCFDETQISEDYLLHEA
ncbi:hypothetical protein [Geobacter sp. OR-1]|uniref:hypothetical protein n=1 Tax=Geobacter sp. OR-1 TaxID=1266765 RepID=UPI001269EC57|nr:hypothetical protein [Geobacter sp. OR-1]